MGRSGRRERGFRSGRCPAQSRGRRGRRAGSTVRGAPAEAAAAVGSTSPVDWQLAQALPGRSRRATGRARSIARSWPTSLPWNCCVRSQLSWSARVVVTAGPAQRCQWRCCSSGRSDQATTCRPLSVRRVRRSVLPSQASAGTARGLLQRGEILLPLGNHGFEAAASARAGPGSIRAPERCRRRPARPCSAMIAIMTSATSTSISVKPRGGARTRSWLAPDDGRQRAGLATVVVEHLGIDAPEVRVRRRPHDQLAVVGAAELLAAEIAVADVGVAARQLQRGELVVGAPLRRA